MKNLSGRVSEIKQTVSGYEVKDLFWNDTIGLITGKVADPQWARPERPFTTASWFKNGKCVNNTRPDCNLQEPSKNS